MGARGPAPDPHQAAKGYPGRRRGKAKEAADRAAMGAALLAPRPVDDVDLPSMLRGELYEGAAHLWRKLAPVLRSTHRLPVESEHAFAMLCIYSQEWAVTTNDLHANGFAQSIKTVAGGKMERRRPMTLDRQQAFSNVLDLSRRFGLTPVDMYDLFKGQAAAATHNPGLFGDERQERPVDEVQETLVGSMAALRSGRPDHLN